MRAPHRRANALNLYIPDQVEPSRGTSVVLYQDAKPLDEFLAAVKDHSKDLRQGFEHGPVHLA